MLFGVMCGSTAVIMIKASTENPFLTASYRLLIAAAALSPLFFRQLKESPGRFGWEQLGWITPPAAALGIHFMSWVIGARMTTVSNASLIANLTPVAMPFLLWLVYRERVNRREIVGTSFTLAGLAVLSGASFRVSATSFAGDMICFGSMLAFAVYLALGRRNSGRINIWLYIVPLYFIAGLISFVCALWVINPVKVYTTANLLYILGLGLIPTVIGHSILNYSMKYFRGQVVSVTNLTQPFFAGLLGFMVFGESPRLAFYPAAALIAVGVLIVLFGQPRPQPEPLPVAD
jgi:drug/metabolite transporter (DMT)-like permease